MTDIDSPARKPIHLPKPDIRLPTLQLEHTPGWKFDAYPDPDPRASDLVVFDSDNEAFNLGYGLDVFATGDVSNSLQPGGIIEIRDMTPDDLADLGNEADRLQMWLDDLATVTQWVIDHRAELARMVAAC